MQTAQQLIEELQIHNLPHNADGSFNITAKQRDAIELLLSNQLLIDQFNIRYLKSEHDYQVKELDELGISNDQFFEQRINTVIALYKALLSQQAVLDDWISVESGDLPEERQEVLVYMPRFGSPISVNFILVNDDGSKYWFNPQWIKHNLKEATHWKPLPQPPAGG